MKCGLMAAKSKPEVCSLHIFYIHLHLYNMIEKSKIKNFPHMNRPHLIPKELTSEIKGRITRIQKKMQEKNIDAMLVSSNVNLFYTTGRFFRGYVYIPIIGDAIYFIIRPQIYHEDDNTLTIRKPEQISDKLEEIGFGIPQKIALEEDVLTFSDYRRLAAIFSKSEKENGSPTLRDVRMVKTPYELDQMHIDADHHVKVYRRIPELYKEGMTDLDLQIEIERELRKEGCLGYPRVAGHLMDINLGSVLVGENADNPSPYDFAMGGMGIDPSLPGGANGTIIKEGVTVMIDMNGAFNGYQTDMTRVWSLGELPDKAVFAHKCSLEILRTLEDLGRPGIPVSDLYMKAEEIVRQWHLEDYFMGYSQKAAFIGHGVGIELNEQPPITSRNKTLLKENMTLALEPKFVIPEVGAVGSENTYAVKPRGLECLTVFDEEIMKL